MNGATETGPATRRSLRTMADLLVPVIANTARIRRPASRLPRSSLLTPPSPTMTDQEIVERAMREVDHDVACLFELIEALSQDHKDDSLAESARDEAGRAIAYLVKLLTEDRYDVFSVIRHLRRDGLLPLSADTLALTGRALERKMDKIARIQCQKN